VYRDLPRVRHHRRRLNHLKKWSHQYNESISIGMSHVPHRDTDTGTHTSIVLYSPPICLPVYEEVEAQNVQLYDEEQGRPPTHPTEPSAEPSTEPLAHGSDDGMRVSYLFPSSTDPIPEPLPRSYTRIPPPPPPHPPPHPPAHPPAFPPPPPHLPPFPPLAVPFSDTYPPVRADPLPRLQTLAQLQNEIRPELPPPPPPPTVCTRITQVASWISISLGLTALGYYIFRNS